MKLNSIPKSGQWNGISDRLNENFSKINAEVESLGEATIKNCGYFMTVEALQHAYPTAGAGSKAYVGASYPYAIYLWDTASSAWVDSGATGGEENVKLEDYYTKQSVDEKVAELESEVSLYESIADDRAIKGTILKKDGAISTDFVNFATYYFDVSSFANKEIDFNASGLADPNGAFALFVVIKSDGTKEVVVNKNISKTIGGSQGVLGYKYTLPSNAVQIAASSHNGVISVFCEGLRIQAIKQDVISVSNLAQEIIPHAIKMAIGHGNLLEGSTYTDGYIDNNGNIVSLAQIYHTDYISIVGCKKLRFSTIMQAGGAFYDENKNFIQPLSSSQVNDIYNEWIVVPSGAHYVRYNNIRERIGKGFEYIIADNIKEEVFVPSLMGFSAKIANLDSTESGYLNSDGTIETSIGGGVIYKYNVVGARAVSITNSSGISEYVQFASIWVTDENKNAIQIVNIKDSHNTFEDYLIALPSNAHEVWVASGNPKVIKFDNSADDKVSGHNQWKDKKIVWLGTSIPWGQTDENNPGTTTRADNPYPSQVCKALGATLIDSTHGGLAQEGAYSAAKNMWYPKPYSEGGMSSGGSCSLTIQECKDAYAQGLTGSDHSRWSYENLVLGKDADLYVFDVEPNNSNGDLADLENFDWYYWGYKDGSDFASHRNTYVGALIYIIDKLLTEKPNAVIVFVGEYGNMSKYAYSEEFTIRTASEAFCKMFHYHYIDLWHKLGYNGKNKLVWLNTDGVHPKQVLYDRIANMMINELKLIS